MTSSVPHENTLVITPPDAGIVRAAGNVGEALHEYMELQKALDAAMPDCIMEIRGQQFRKKKYWRAVATAFNIDVTLLGEPRKEVTDDGDWGYIVTARAVAPNGRVMDGDGACFASEKPGHGQATVHNVRAHAVTRAKNRAIADLCGFGEVSADEINEQGEYHPPQPAGRSTVPEQGEAWLRAPMIGKKYKGKDWQYMIEGSVGGERHDYLIYMHNWLKGKLDQEPKGKFAAKNRADLERVEACLAIYGKRDDEDTAVQQELPDDGAEGF